MGPLWRWRSSSDTLRAIAGNETARLILRTAHKVPGKSGGIGLRDDRWQTPENNETAGQKANQREYSSSVIAAESSQRVRGSSP
jgi:hypothetical protein